MLLLMSCTNFSYLILGNIIDLVTHVQLKEKCKIACNANYLSCTNSDVMACHLLLFILRRGNMCVLHTGISTVFEIRGVHSALEQLKERYLWT